MSDDTTLSSEIVTVTLTDTIPVIHPVSQSFLYKQAMDFHRIMIALLKNNHQHVILDLMDCEYISSEGLGEITSFWQKINADQKGQMAVAVSYKKNAEVMNLFDITGITNLIGSALQPSIDDALSYLKSFSIP